MANTISYDKGSKTVTATVTFVPDSQVEKSGMAKSSIENYLWSQVASIAQRLAQAALAPPVTADIDSYIAVQKAALDAEAALKKAATFTSDVTANK